MDASHVASLSTWIAAQFAAGVTSDMITARLDSVVEAILSVYRVSSSDCGSVAGLCELSAVAGAPMGNNKPQDGELCEKVMRKRKVGARSEKRKRNRANRRARRGEGSVAPVMDEYQRRKLELEEMRTKAYVESRAGFALRNQLEVKRTDAYVATQTAVAQQSYASVLKSKSPTIVTRVSGNSVNHSITRSGSASEASSLLPSDSVSQQSSGAGRAVPVGRVEVAVPEDSLVVKKTSLTEFGRRFARCTHRGVIGYLIDTMNVPLGGQVVNIVLAGKSAPMVFVPERFVIYDKTVYFQHSSVEFRNQFHGRDLNKPQ